MFLPSVNLGLPGEVAGPSAIFTVSEGALLLDENDNEVAVSRTGYEMDGRIGDILIPDQPLAPGIYHLDFCSAGAVCETTIVADVGDPGTPPAVPELAMENTRVFSGRFANCRPKEAATKISVESDAPVVVFASEPQDSLSKASIIGFARAFEGEEMSWTTTYEGDLVVAAIDAEGELSAWSEPYSLSPGACSTTGTSVVPGMGLVLGAVLLRRRRA